MFVHDSGVVSFGKLLMALKGFGSVGAEWLSKWALVTVRDQNGVLLYSRVLIMSHQLIQFFKFRSLLSWTLYLHTLQWHLRWLITDATKYCKIK